MTEVFIQGKRLDLDPATVVALTRQINDIAEIQQRQADYTNRFIAPFTPNNKIIAEMLNVPGNNSIRPYKYGSAVIISNGITITNSGVAILTETKNRASYEYIIYAGNYDLYSRILDKYITDLPWDDLIHTFDNTQLYDQNDRTENYIYPIAETLDGRLNVRNLSAGEIDPTYMIPHVFVKTIWKRIFKDAGLEYYGDFFDDNPEFKNELVPADRNYAKDITTPLDTFEGFQSGNAYYFTIDANGDGHFVIKLNVDSIAEPSESFDEATDIYTVPETGNYQFNFASSLQVSWLKDFIFKIKVDGIFVQAVVQTIAQEDPDHTDFQPYFVTLYLTQSLLKGQQVEFYYELANSPSVGFIIVHVIAPIVTIKQKDFLIIPYGSVIDFSLLLPKILQIDFLKAIMQQYGLLYRQDNEGRYEFITIENLLNGKQGIKNFTSKLISETSELYTIESYSKSNVVDYKYNDKDLLGDKYADSKFNIDIDTLKKEGTVVDSIIEACGDYLDTFPIGRIASIHSYEKQDITDGNPFPYKLSDNDNLKTVILKRRQPSSDIHLVAGFIVSIYWTADTLYPFVDFDPLSWKELLKKYYTKFIALVQRPVKKRVLLWLTPVDIYFLNMFKIIYLEQYQSYFYLNRVNSFIGGKPSDCELIKINDAAEEIIPTQGVCGLITNLVYTQTDTITKVRYDYQVFTGYTGDHIEYVLEILEDDDITWTNVPVIDDTVAPGQAVRIDRLAVIDDSVETLLQAEYGTPRHYRIKLKMQCGAPGVEGEYTDWLEFNY